MWDWYIKTEDLIFNERYAEILGYELRDLPPKFLGWESRINPEDWPDVKEKLYSHLEGVIPAFEVEYRIKNKKGEWIWIQDSGKVVSWDRNGQPERAVGIILEITARKEIETALKKSNQRYHEVFENTSDGIFLIDVTPKGQFRYTGFNSSEEKILGLSGTEFIGKAPEELFSPEISSAFNANYRRCIETGALINYEQVLHLPIGKKYLYNTLIPVNNANGKVHRIIGISQDVTERKKMEDIAVAEERRLRSLVYLSEQKSGTLQKLLDYALEEAIALSASQYGYILYYSEEKQEFTGHTWSEKTVERCTVTNPPGTFELQKAGIWAEAVRQRQPIVINDFLIPNPQKKGLPEGHVPICRFMTVPIFINKHIAGIISVANKATDYTELDQRELTIFSDTFWKIFEIRATEAALTKSEEKFSKIFYKNPVSMALISMDGRKIMDINDAFEHRSGYRRAEVAGIAFSDLGGSSNKLSFERVFGKLEAEGGIRGIELEWVTKAGGAIIIRIAADVVEFGGRLCALTAVEDITEQREIEQSLASSMAMYQTIITATNNAVFLLDSDRYSILEANPAAQDLFGYTLEELKRLDFIHLFSMDPEEAIKMLRGDINKAWREGSSARRGFGKRENGELLQVWLYFNIVRINEQDRVLVVINDLSEEIRFQEEHEKAVRYEAQAMKMTTISAISAGVVHEISQPLSSIKVLSDGILYRQEIGHIISMAEAFAALNKISTQAERINDIIRHIRNLANSTENDNNSPTDLNKAIIAAMRILGSQMADHGIRIEMVLDQSLSPVWAQEQFLEEIIINLIVNAMHALDEFEPEIKKIACVTRQDKNLVVMEVADNGPGIKTEIGCQIWDPFFSTRKGGGGMGLGLVIVQSIISRLKGNITYYNNEWGGATFRVELPAFFHEITQDRQK